MFVMDSSLLHREIAEFRASGDEDNQTVDESVALTLLKDIRRRMTPQPLKIRADVELTCFQYDGVLHIKSAMFWGSRVTLKNVLNKKKQPVFVGIL